MKRICILFLMISSAARGANAQTVTGSGTTGRIPQFTGTTTIGDSAIFQLDGNIGIGTTTPDSTLRVFNFKDSGFGPYAIYATLNNSTTNFSAAIFGESLGTTGGTNGVLGLTSSQSSAGVNGVSVASDGGGFGVLGALQGDFGGGGGGVLGVTHTTTGFSTAVRGGASGASGGAVAIFGEQNSPEASVGVFINRAFGDILQGRVGAPDVGVFRVDGQGTVFANGGFRANVAAGDIIVGGVGQPEVNVFRVDDRGTVFADGGFRPFGADFAESVAVNGSAGQYVPGDLLVIDASGERRLALSQTPYSTLVAGIYSTKPGVVASQHRVGEASPENEVPLAVVGIVPCKVTAENGSIAAGDLLVASSTPGHAMKGTDRSKMLGAVVGKALEPLHDGIGLIQVLVTLQ